MLRVGTVVLGASDVRRAARFWAEALGYRPREPEEETTVDFTVLVPAPGVAGPGISVARSATAVQSHPRVHLDLYAGDAADQAAEVERLMELGAERVDWDGYDGGADFVVLGDTEGNCFCVVDTSGHAAP